MKPAHVLAAALSAACLPAGAQTAWTDWTTFTAGAPGSAAGTLGGIAVNYTGAVLGNTLVNGSFAPFWAPIGSFVGGTITASPATVGDIITLTVSPNTSTISFAAPVTNPVFAIWSLGQPGLAASFTFNATPTFQVGGPNVSFGGRSITVAGNTVSGNEGNGVVQFDGTFSSISFTSTAENYYGFTIGTNPTVNAIPEPETWAMLAIGLAAIGFVARRRRPS